jgi:CRP-like cAMP-binding protein
MNEPGLIYQIEQTLKTTSHLRTAKQTQYLCSFLSELAFFKSYIVPVGEDIMMKASEYVGYEYFQESAYIFRYGDPGDKFYIILEGLVRVLIPSQSDSYSFYEATTLTQGASFGEYALLYNQPRLASIQCAKNTHLAVLSKDSYLQILGKIENKRIEDSVKLLRSFQIFKNWSKGPIIKIGYFFNERTLSRKTILCKEGEVITEVFFIKQGELELVKSIQEDSPERKNFRAPVKKRCINVSILSSGEVVGGEVLTGGRHLYTCKVYSLMAQVLVISKNDFCNKVKNEESQNIIRRNYESKEKERGSRVGSLEKIKNFYKDGLEEQVSLPSAAVKTRTSKYFSESPEKKQKHQSESHLKKIIKGSRAELKTESIIMSQKLMETRLSPLNRHTLRRKTDKRYVYPIRIEQKQIIDRYKTPEGNINRYFNS